VVIECSEVVIECFEVVIECLEAVYIYIVQICVQSVYGVF